jgi:GT2 family glycosyltransferase
MPSAAPLVLVVILNYNAWPQTVAAVDSVLAMDYPNFRVLLIDNASADDSVAELRKLAGVEFLASPVNTGYTGGCNLGFARAQELAAGYAWLLNNDTVVPAHTLSSLVALAESDPRIGLVTPQIASLPASHLTFAGGVLDVAARVYDETNDPEQARAWAAEFPDAGLVIGTAMLVRMELVRRIGTLDDRFFMYYEDIDFNARSSAAGFRNLVDAAVTVRHLEKNRNRNPRGMKPHYWYYNARNAGRFWRKHLGPVRSLRLRWWSFNKFLLYRNQCRANPVAGQAILAGLWHELLDRGGPYHPAFRMPRPVAWLVDLYSGRAVLHKPPEG